ncbi:hypothetical protein VOLCADRAFT_92026 [Volvox carteri f. nagariensis]|uniref:Uncharacterized protein n=1 Tax=Volvox carteri f. nagariensis TaxID=3068 RepID=D8TYX0_VOLCA|nr:uncharacterized protein VOLCADRAFT_92026 [Volvox carteri f. nagariensis]EFJ47387.1 hypothetical protein VOLCADRAFT_92026 [Volvox carteri f. nagariensis]|eukprot:XP_002951576.1 hypothetical protein VOLCADRAFT_92026 [Volvox carteri f. nagariensis]
MPATDDRAADTSWLHVSNTIVYFLAFCINVLVNSGAVFRTVRSVDRQFGPVLTPAGWSYYIRDLTLFLWGLGVTCQSLVEHKGWKDGLVACIGYSCFPPPPTPRPRHPRRLLTRVAVLVPELQRELLAAGFRGVPPLAYLIYVYPTSLACGWLLVHQCHVTALATGLVTSSHQAALNVGCVTLVLATALALLLLVRLRDVVFGLAFTWGCVAVWVAGFTTQEDYRPDQLVAFFCGLVMGMLTYCVAAGPQVRMAWGGWTAAVTAPAAALPPPPPPPAPAAAPPSPLAATGGMTSGAIPATNN